MDDFRSGDLAPGAGGADWQARSLKRTKAREVVHALLQDALRDGRHLDVETLYRQARRAKAPVSLGTLYRVLGDFEQCGLVQAHVFEGMRKVYELDAGQPQDHVVNLDTGEISHLSAPAMDACCAGLAGARGVEVVRRRVTLYVRGAVPDR